jgi:hypothetical protein
MKLQLHVDRTLTDHWGVFQLTVKNTEALKNLGIILSLQAMIFDRGIVDKTMMCEAVDHFGTFYNSA